MPTILLILLFVVMIAAPCMIAVRSSRVLNQSEEPEAEEVEPEPEPQPMVAEAARPHSLREIAAEAEFEANMAQQRATAAHRAALMATARAAALRADVAAEVAAAAGRAAQNAFRVAEAEMTGYHLPESHPSLDFPRAKASRTRAA